MKLIKLSKGYYAKVDDEDYIMLSKRSWHVNIGLNTSYAMTAFKKKDGTFTDIYMHRIILGLTNSKIHTDHIDHDGLNNQKSNLRTCTHSQNQMNKRSLKNASSKYLGVTIAHNKTKLRYKVFIQRNKKLKYLGVFDNELRAAIEYDKNAIILHGEFANLNILKVRK